MAVSTCIIFAGLLSLVVGEFNVASIKTCSGVPEDKCTVNQVRIDPCKEGASQCVFPKGINASIEIDFTPDFNTNNLKTGASYRGVGFPGLMDKDCCEFTQCPTTAGQQHSLAITLPIGTKLPTGIFNFDWKVWNADNPEVDKCCFQTTVKLIRSPPKK